MTETFKAFVIDRKNDTHVAGFQNITESYLMDGDVDVDVDYSTLNYKDGLAITGRQKVVRKTPLIGGIDFAGVVSHSRHHEFKKGDNVVLNGYGIGETHHGGYAQKARVKGDWLIKLPKSIDTEAAMAIGTAGYTAMLALMRLQQNNVNPSDGPVIVTGANGGVGSVAIALLSYNGYETIAVTRKQENEDYLKHLGASEVVLSEQFTADAPLLGRAIYAGAIDSVGGNILANVLSQIKYGGGVAACGLAMSAKLNTSVAPFILRAVRLIGIDSVMAEKKLRKIAWERLAEELEPEKIASLTFLAGFEELPELAEKITTGNIRGRAVIAIR